MKIILSISLTYVIVQLTGCFKVYDEIDPSKYCPMMEHCDPPDQHAVCKYYNPMSEIGPDCKNYTKHVITPELVVLILSLINTMRGRVATGTEVGQDNIPLPRAYGMVRMKWCSELAAISQLVTDQCSPVNDYSCAATERFPRPITGNVNTDVKDITAAIISSFKYFKKFKDNTLPEHIYNSPSMIRHDARRYLKIVQAKATHVGCGLAGFQEDNAFPKIYLRCYYSYCSDENEQVYPTELPAPETGYSKTCGCPPGYIETEDCLCEGGAVDPTIKRTNSTTTETQDNDDTAITTTTMEITTSPTPTTPTEGSLTTSTQPYVTSSEYPINNTCASKEGKCEPNIVMLPIFTIEDAPSKDILRNKMRRNRINRNRVHRKRAKRIKYKQYRRFKNESIESEDPLTEEIDYVDESYEEPTIEYEIKPKKKNRKKLKKYADLDILEAILGTKKPFKSKPKPKGRNDDTLVNKIQKYETSDKENGDSESVMSLLDILHRKGANGKFNSLELEVFSAQVKRLHETIQKKILNNNFFKPKENK